GCLLPLLLHLPNLCPAGIDEIADSPLPSVEDDEIGTLALHELVQGLVGVVAVKAGCQLVDVPLVKLQHVVGRDLVESDIAAERLSPLLVRGKPAGVVVLSAVPRPNRRRQSHRLLSLK